MTSPLPAWRVEGRPCGHLHTLELRLTANDGTPRRRFYCLRCGARWQLRPNDRPKHLIEGEPCAHADSLTGYTIEFGADALHYVNCLRCGARWAVEEQGGALRRPQGHSP